MNSQVVIPNTARSLVRSSWKSIGFYHSPSGNDGWEEEGRTELPDPEPTEVEEVEPLPKVFDDEEVYTLKGRKWEATGKLTTEGFVVFAGSKVNAAPESFRRNPYFPARAKCEEDGVIVDGVFTRDFIFRSAAAAACVVAAGMKVARKAWVYTNEEGLTMTFGEAHPIVRSKKVRRAKAKPRARKPARETLEGGVAVVRYRAQGREVEWRGQMPFRPEGVYMGVRCAQQ